VLEAGDRFHGVSVHFVTEELDGGPVVAQVTIPVLSNDNKDSLAQRVATQEHRIYPEVVSWFSAGRLRILHGAACLDQVVLPAQGVQVNINGTHAHAHINKPNQ
jgi:phosphoribosylglycinamide formyltransferase-1